MLIEYVELSTCLLRLHRCRKPADGGTWHELMRNMDENTVLPLAEEEQVNNDDLKITVAGGGTPMVVDDEDNDDDVDADHPHWQLFLTAKNLTIPSSE